MNKKRVLKLSILCFLIGITLYTFIMGIGYAIQGINSPMIEGMKTYHFMGNLYLAASYCLIGMVALIVLGVICYLFYFKKKKEIK